MESEAIEQDDPAPLSTEDAAGQVDELLAEALGGQLPDTGETPTAEPEADREEETGNDDAEPEMEAEGDETPEIDYDLELEIPLPDGAQPIKLGELKDAYVEQQRNQVALTERENAVMRKYDEINQVMQVVGEIPPELQEQARQMHAAQMQSEHNPQMQAIPEMDTRDGFIRVKEAVLPVLNDYGVTAEQAAMITDHRVIKMAYDLSKQRAAQETAKQAVEKAKPAKMPKGKRVMPAGKKSQIEKLYNAARANPRNEQLRDAALDSLLKG